jgi:hypothetical protein
MALKYESIVPWGRSYMEYIDMFNLTESDMNKIILGCGDGPASFNSIMNQKGKQAISIDPIYQFNEKEIEKRIEETFINVINQTRNNKDKFIWTRIKDVDDLGRIRMSAMKEFLLDFEKGKKEKRYVHAELPNLPFSVDQFDLTISSHFLLFYSDNLTYDFHLNAINEMLRVSKEVRIFPIIDVNNRTSPYLKNIIEHYRNKNVSVEEIKVNYEFQKNGNKMLKIKK